VTAQIDQLYADSEVDVRLLTFEQAAKEIMRCLIGVAPGELVEIKVADPTIAGRLIEWARTIGQKIIGSSADSDSQRVYLERQY